MTLDTTTLEVFDGATAPDDFLDDLEVFLGLDNKTQMEAISNTVRWYPEKSVDEEWNAWTKGKSKEDEQKLKVAVKVTLFIIQRSYLRRLTDAELTGDLTKLGFDEALASHFAKTLRDNEARLGQKMARTDDTIVPTVRDIVWRIDVKKSSAYAKQLEKPCAILKVTFSPKGEVKDAIFELSRDEVKSLVRLLNTVQRELDVLVQSC